MASFSINNVAIRGVVSSTPRRTEENKDYPIYAWMDCAVEVPLPRKEK